MPSTAKPRFRRRAVFLTGVGAIALGLASLWIARRPIAEKVVGDWLAGRGVAARIHIDELTTTSLIAHGSLGPSGRPELTVGRLAVDYTLDGGFKASRLSLSDVVLRAAWNGQKLQFGHLQRVIDEVTAPSQPNGPAPDIQLRRARVILSTTLGEANLFGDGDFRKGRLDQFSATTGALRLARGGQYLMSPGASLSVKRTAGVLAAQIDAPVSEVDLGAVKARRGHLALTARAAYPDTAGLHGAARLSFDLQAAEASVGEARFADLAIRGSGQGQAVADAKGIDFDGGADLLLSAGNLSAAKRSAHGVAAQVALTSVRFDMSGGVIQWRGRVRGEGHVHEASGPEGSASEVRLTALGQAADGAGLLTGSLAGGFKSGLLAKGAPPAFAQTLGQNWRLQDAGWRLGFGPKAFDLTLTRPAVLTGDGGEHVTLDAGAQARLSAAGASADHVALSLGGGQSPAGSLTLESLKLAGTEAHAVAAVDFSGLGAFGPGHLKGRFGVDLGSERLRVSLLDCLDIAYGSAEILSWGGRVCALPGRIMLDARNRAWDLALRVESGEIDDHHAVKVDALAGDLVLAGDHDGPREGQLSLKTLSVIETDGARNFAPLTASGGATLKDHADVAGDFAIATRSGEALGHILVTDNLKTSIGEARIDTGEVLFGEKILQPADIWPGLNAIRRAHGHMRFAGSFNWTAKTLDSQGYLSSNDLGFLSPAGDVIDVAGAIRFTSLFPPKTEPNQSLAIRRIDGVTTFGEFTATFDVDDDALSVHFAGANMAGGHIRLEPTTVKLVSGAVLKSAVVLDHVDLGQLIEKSSLGEKMKAEAVINGRLPFEFGSHGLKFDKGEIAAVGPGRVEVSREALESAVSDARAAGPMSTNAVEDFAYQAVGNLAFDDMKADVESTPDDRLRLLFVMHGRFDPKKPQVLAVPVRGLVNGTAFDKPLPLPSGTQINLTLDTYLNFGELMRSLEHIWAQQTPNADSSQVQTKKP